MKGALDIEFILSSFLFLTTIVFIALSVIRALPVLQEKSISENLQSVSFQVSEVLLSPGHPSNWDDPFFEIEDVGRIGLESTDYVLDPNKVSKLYTFCTGVDNYRKLRSKFHDNDVIIIVNGTLEYLNCVPPAVSLIRPQFVTTRHAIYNGEAVDLTVVVLG